MQNNYAYESGSFMALARMMRDKIRDLDSEDEFDREWAVKCLVLLADQTDKTLIELGYQEETQ